VRQIGQRIDVGDDADVIHRQLQHGATGCLLAQDGRGAVLASQCAQRRETGGGESDRVAALPAVAGHHHRDTRVWMTRRIVRRAWSERIDERVRDAQQRVGPHQRQVTG